LVDTIKRTKNIFNAKFACPTMLIALDWNIFIWTISLWISDIPERQDLFPFVASLYVKPEYRRRWVAKKLVQEIEKIARNNNWNELYLNDWSEIKWFYEKMWFSFYENDSYKWKNYLIYKKILK
jgi:GNAT superfamily N-acetyltransferase